MRPMPGPAEENPERASREARGTLWGATKRTEPVWLSWTAGPAQENESAMRLCESAPAYVSSEKKSAHWDQLKEQIGT